MVKKWKSTVMVVGLGLLLSLLATSTLFATSELARKGINAPASQFLLSYALLALFKLYRRKPHKVKLYYYIMLTSLIEVLANFFMIEAIQHTSLTSFVLLHYWTITCSLLFGSLFFKKIYGVQILFGLAICVTSYAIVFVSDVHSVHERSSVISLVKGDMFIIIGATLSSVSLVIQDFLKKNEDGVTHNAFLDIFCAILTALQIAISERNEFKFILLSSHVAIFLVIGFSLSRIFLYIGTNFFYKVDGSTMLNLPILITYHIWIILIRIFAYHEKVDWIYFVAVVLTILGHGLILFSRVDPNNGKPSIDEDTDFGHLDNIEISNKDGNLISSVELQNSLCHMSCQSEVNG